MKVVRAPLEGKKWSLLIFPSLKKQLVGETAEKNNFLGGVKGRQILVCPRQFFPIRNSGSLKRDEKAETKVEGWIILRQQRNQNSMNNNLKGRKKTRLYFSMV